MEIRRNPTRAVVIGSITIGGGHPIAVQSMTATSTRNVAATVRQVKQLADAGADVVRIAVDSRSGRRGAGRDPPTDDGQPVGGSAGELSAGRSGRAARRQDPLQPRAPVPSRAGQAVAGESALSGRRRSAARCALRVGVNCGSVDPAKREKYDPDDAITPMLESAWEHCELLDSLGFTRYCVSLKDSDPAQVVEVNRRFAAARPDVPLHLGVTEAGMPPEGIIEDPAGLRATDRSRHRGHDPRVADRPQRSEAAGDRGGPADPGRHSRRPTAQRRAARATRLEHHLLPQLLARGERGVCGTGTAGQSDDTLRPATTPSRSPSWAVA